MHLSSIFWLTMQPIGCVAEEGIRVESVQFQLPFRLQAEVDLNLWVLTL